MNKRLNTLKKEIKIEDKKYKTFYQHFLINESNQRHVDSLNADIDSDDNVLMLKSWTIKY